MAHEHAHHGAHGADAEYLPVPGSTYEHTDADTSSIIRFGFWLAVFAIAAHVILGGAFAAAISWAKETGEPRYPLAQGQPPLQPPAPRLQQYPDRDMTSFRATDENDLDSYGWVDRATGSVHIPIDEAIRLTLERGLPSRAQDQVSTPGLMATDASAGRVLERRRQ